MIGDLFDSPRKILIVAVVLIVLFGSKKLPDAARSSQRQAMMLAFGIAFEIPLLIVILNRRRARRDPDPYAGLADDELSPIELGDTENLLT